MRCLVLLRTAHNRGEGGHFCSLSTPRHALRKAYSSQARLVSCMLQAALALHTGGLLLDLGGVLSLGRPASAMTSIVAQPHVFRRMYLTPPPPQTTMQPCASQPLPPSLAQCPQVSSRLAAQSGPSKIPPRHLPAGSGRPAGGSSRHGIR